MRSERNVNAQPVSLRDELACDARTAAVEHLELEAVGGDFAVGDEPLDRGDQSPVVRRDSRIYAAKQEFLRQSQIALAYIGHALIRDLGGLVIGTLAKSHARAERDRALHVARRPLEVGLQHRPGVFARCENLFEQPQRRFQHGGALHVDAYEWVGVPRRPLDDRAEVLARKPFVYEQTHGAELDGDV